MGVSDAPFLERRSPRHARLVRGANLGDAGFLLLDARGVLSLPAYLGSGPEQQSVRNGRCRGRQGIAGTTAAAAGTTGGEKKDDDQ